MDSSELIMFQELVNFLQWPSTLLIYYVKLVYLHTYQHMNVMSMSMQGILFMVLKASFIFNKIQIHRRIDIGYYLLYFYVHLT